jgi:hypothetical protein
MSYFGMGIVNFIANIFGGSTPNSLYDLMNQIPNYIIKKIADDALGSAITKNELKTNSPIIAGLQQYRPQMPMIAIYGIEDNPAFLRLAGARFDNKDNAKPLYQIDDTKVVSIVNTLADLSHSEVDVNNTLCYLSLLCIPCIIYYSWAADQWQISADYYSGQLQTGCDFLIGAKRNGYEDATYIDWVCDNSPKPLPIEMKSTKIAACKWPQDYHPVVKTKSVSIIISTPSDGLLPSDTEMGMPGCSETNKYQALHVNHEELKNHQSVTILLDQIFNGQKYDTRDPYFFKINPK